MIHIDIRKALVSHKTQLKISHEQIKEYFHAMAAEVASSIKQNKSKVRTQLLLSSWTYEAHFNNKGNQEMYSYKCLIWIQNNFAS